VNGPTFFPERWPSTGTPVVYDEPLDSPPEFPLKVIYTVRREDLLVAAVFHARRKPGYWMHGLERLG
jgi:hypothetical protein